LPAETGHTRSCDRAGTRRKGTMSMEPSVGTEMPGVTTALIRVAAFVGIVLVELLAYVRRQEPGRTRWPQVSDVVLICTALVVIASFLWF